MGVFNPTPITEPYQLYNLGLSTSVAASALTVTLTQFDGSSAPSAGSAVLIGFRSSTSANGNYNTRAVTSSISLTVPSGATLGTASGVATYLWVYGIDNAGTVALAISQCLFDDGSIQSTTTISAGATSNSTIYSTTGVSNVPIRVLGRLLISEATAGTWTSGPTEVDVSPTGNVNASLPIVARAYWSANTGSVSGTETVAALDTTAVDTINGVSGLNTTSFKYTIPVTGYYAISGNAAANSSTAGTYVARIRLTSVSGTLVSTGSIAVNAATSNAVAPIPTVVLSLTAGSVIVLTDQAATGTWTRNASMAAFFLSVQKID